MVRYPYTAVITWTEQLFNIATGLYTIGSEIVKTLKCSAASNGKGVHINGIDGNMVLFDYVLYTSRLNYNIPYGAKVVLSMPNSTINTTVKRVETTQLSTIIWV